MRLAALHHKEVQIEQTIKGLYQFPQNHSLKDYWSRGKKMNELHDSSGSNSQPEALSTRSEAVHLNPEIEAELIVLLNIVAGDILRAFQLIDFCSLQSLHSYLIARNSVVVMKELPNPRAKYK